MPLEINANKLKYVHKLSIVEKCVFDYNDGVFKQSLEEVIMPYQTMNQMADDLKQLIDSFWKLELSEQQFITKMSATFSNTTNRGLAMRGLSFKAGFERALGKKRIEEIKKTLVKIDGDLYKGLN